ncbi:hypothetical protein DMA11_21820 [Marinilabiliaceae bacterium JC017]|nr:hypothetical protein DMA11_21820 [Marinilabiliaceae bacterium JC017]
MKKQIGIWLDTDKAVLISLTNGQESVKTINSDVEHRSRFPGEGKNYSRLGSMLVNPVKRATNRKKHQLHHYFDQIIKDLSGASSVYLIGPSNTKKLLAKEIKKHHPVEGIPIDLESADKMTDNQLLAKVKNYFKEHK